MPSPTVEEPHHVFEEARERIFVRIEQLTENVGREPGPAVRADQRIAIEVGHGLGIGGRRDDRVRIPELDAGVAVGGRRTWVQRVIPEQPVHALVRAATDEIGNLTRRDLSAEPVDREVLVEAPIEALATAEVARLVVELSPLLRQTEHG
jgi:hypothetical protein